MSPSPRQSLRMILATARAGNWWFSKLPPLTIVAYASMSRHHTDPGQALTALLAILTSLSLVAWYAHVVNDLFDIDDDRQAGKPNRMEDIPRPAGLLLAAGLAGVALVIPLVALERGLGVAGWVSGNLLVFAMYSVPPIRLKVRGWWGVAADAMGAHVLPALSVMVAMNGVSATTRLDVGLAGVTAVWAFAAGLRNILGHQYDDAGADRRALVAMVGNSMTRDWLHDTIRRRIIPIEMIGVVAFVLLITPSSPLALLALLGCALGESLKVRAGWRMSLLAAPRAMYPYIPFSNNDLYELWLPVALSLGLAVQAPEYAILPVLQAILFWPGMRRRGQDVTRAAQQVARGTSPAFRPARSPARRVIDALEGFAGRRYPVILSATEWDAHGISAFIADLALGLQARGWPVHVIVTERVTDATRVALKWPAGIRIVELRTPTPSSWGARWGELVWYLESSAPCIYMPNADWRHSAVCPLLSNRVAVAGVVFGDDAIQRDHTARLARYWNALVALDEPAARQLVETGSGWADRVITIPVGVRTARRRSSRRPAGRDLLRVLCRARNDAERDVLGAVAELIATRSLRVSLAEIEPATAPDRVSAELAASDVYLSFGARERFDELLEAMAAGTVPVLVAAHGVSSPVVDGESGLIVDQDTAVLASCLERLERDRLWRQGLALGARRAVRREPRTIDMVRDYEALFRRVTREAATGQFERPRGELSSPPAVIDSASVFPVALSFHVPGVGAFPAEADYEAFRERVRPVAGLALSDYLVEISSIDRGRLAQSNGAEH